MRRLWLAAVATIALAPGARASAAPASVRPLIDRMTKTGRAEARVVLTVSSAGDSASSRPAALALEPPDRLRLDYAVGGERLRRRPPLPHRRAALFYCWAPPSTGGDTVASCRGGRPVYQ